MEHTIGNLGQEIQQPSNLFANLAQHALQQSQVNTLKSIYPELDPNSRFQLSTGAVDIGGGYIMLRPWDKYATEILGHSAADVLAWAIGTSRIRRWRWAQLPNGQVARSLWSKQRCASQKVQISYNVKVCKTLILWILCWHDMTPLDGIRWANRIWGSPILLPPVHNQQSSQLRDNNHACTHLSLLSSSSSTLGWVVKYTVGLPVYRCWRSPSCSTFKHHHLCFCTVPASTTWWPTWTLVCSGEVRVGGRSIGCVGELLGDEPGAGEDM